MERLALLTIYFLSVSWGVNGAMSTPEVGARKGYNPYISALAGGLVGFLGALLIGLLARAIWPEQPINAVVATVIGGWVVLRLLWHYAPDIDLQTSGLPLGTSLKRNIIARHIRGNISTTLFVIAIAIALVALATLVATIINKSFGLTAVQYEREPEALAVTAYDPGAPLGEVPHDQVPVVLADNVRPVRLQELVLERIVEADPEAWAALKTQPVSAVLGDNAYPDDLASVMVGELSPQQATSILTVNLSDDQLQELVYTEAGRGLSALSRAELIAVLTESFSAEELQGLILTRVAGHEDATPIPADPVWQVVKVVQYPADAAEKPYSMLTSAESATILAHNLEREQLEEIVIRNAGAGLIVDERPLVRVMRPLEDLTAEESATVLAENLTAEQIQLIVLDELGVPQDDLAMIMAEALGQVLQGKQYPAVLELMPFGQLNANQGADLLMQNLSINALRELVSAQVGAEMYTVGRPLRELPESELAGILASEVRATRLRVLLLDMAGVPQDVRGGIGENTVEDVISGYTYPGEVAAAPFNTLDAATSAQILMQNLETAQLQALVQAEARDRLLEELPETVLASVLAENVSVERLHSLIASEVLLADNPDWPQIELEPVLSPEQAADILMRNLDRDTFETLVFKEADANLIAKRDIDQLATVLANHVRKDHLQELILTEVIGANPDDRSFSGDITWTVLKGTAYPDELGTKPFNELTTQEAADILVRNMSREMVEEVFILETNSRDLYDVPERALGAVMAVNMGKNLMRTTILEEIVGASRSEFPGLSSKPIGELLRGENYPEALADLPFSKVTPAQAADLLERNLSRAELEDLVFDNVVVQRVADSWTLDYSLTRRDSIEHTVETNYPRADLKWRSWVNEDFLSNSINYDQPDATGVRPALFGSILIIIITILFAFPIGVGAAIYLEEYAGMSRINRIIQTNINNLAGVPSIIYGMLGLAIFVRALEHFTSGNAFGTDGQNGRTVLSAGFTLALLILPLIIINAQEAIRAVPASLRQASYGLGATKWQTIWNHVLPYAMPGVLTGTILAISRAIGETAPLILVGGATFLTKDPDGPFAQFTALPLVIYRLTTLPQDEFRNAAAAAIVVLLALLLTMNSIAVILRNRFSRRLS